MSSMSSEPIVSNPVVTVPALPPIPWTERYFRLLWGIVGIVGFLFIWQLGVVSGLLDRLFVSSPIDVIITAFRLLPSRDFAVHLISTAQCLFGGLLIAVVVGIVVGLPLGWFPRLNAIFEPVIAGIYGVPYIAFLPVIIMWTGIGMTSRIIIVVWSAVFPVMINAIQGAREVENDYLRSVAVSQRPTCRCFSRSLYHHRYPIYWPVCAQASAAPLSALLWPSFSCPLKDLATSSI